MSQGVNPRNRLARPLRATVVALGDGSKEGRARRSQKGDSRLVPDPRGVMVSAKKRARRRDATNNPALEGDGISLD